MDHPGFWWELSGKIGAPIFSATLVGCLLQNELTATHGALLAAGLVLMALAHWREHHAGADAR